MVRILPGESWKLNPSYLASLKLAAMSIKIDVLSAEQKKYLTSWETGT